jgi:hypothetical protein
MTLAHNDMPIYGKLSEPTVKPISTEISLQYINFKYSVQLFYVVIHGFISQLQKISRSLHKHLNIVIIFASIDSPNRIIVHCRGQIKLTILNSLFVKIEIAKFDASLLVEAFRKLITYEIICFGRKLSYEFILSP